MKRGLNIQIMGITQEIFTDRCLDRLHDTEQQKLILWNVLDHMKT